MNCGHATTIQPKKKKKKKTKVLGPEKMLCTFIVDIGSLPRGVSPKEKGKKWDGSIRGQDVGGYP